MEKSVLMTAKTERDLEDELGPSPHPAFKSRDEPWKDHELMVQLDEKHTYQYEVAHVLGTTPSKISYWMDKAHENWTPEVDDEELKCKFFDTCHGEMDQVSAGLCNTCLDLLRHDQSESGENIREEFEGDEDREKYIEALHEQYDHEEIHA